MQRALVIADNQYKWTMKKIVLFLFLIWSSPSLAQEMKGRPSHQQWDKLLKKYVSDHGAVNYNGLLSEKDQVDAYLDLLDRNPPQSYWSREEKLAFWINTYNAATVKLILDNYPVESIQDLHPDLKIPFIRDVWHLEFFTIGGEERSLDEVEHGILRKAFNEPRIHFAVNCASISCPILLNEAFQPVKLEAQLTQQARAFINNPYRNQINQDQAYLSKIFKWFTGDFTENGTLVDFINQYSDTQISEETDIDHLAYNWKLNDRPASEVVRLQE